MPTKMGRGAFLPTNIIYVYKELTHLVSQLDTWTNLFFVSILVILVSIIISTRWLSTVVVLLIIVTLYTKDNLVNDNLLFDGVD